MRVQRWLVGVAVAAALGACKQEAQNGGDTRLNDEKGVPAGAIPADNGSAANPAAAGVPLDSAAAPAAGDSVMPVLGK
jgi:hypothetical protein